MTITTFENLQQWFSAQNKAGETASHWNLYGTKFGETEKRVAFNSSIDDKQQSFDYLVQNIRALNNPDGAVFRLQVFPKGKQNNPTGTVYIQVYEKTAPASSVPGLSASPAAIAGMPAGLGSVQDYIAEKIETEKLKWRLEQLEEQAAAPNNTFERVIETIGAIPGIDKALQALIVGLVTKYNPASIPAVQSAMNGTPAPVPEPEGEAAEDDSLQDDPQTIFAHNINSAAQRLNTDPLTLSAKLNELITQNPDLAKQLLNG